MTAFPRATRAAIAALWLAMLVLTSGPASGATPSAHGYWWRLQTGVGPKLHPSNVPSGGLLVAFDSRAGETARSAVRYKAPARTEIRTLVLRVADASGQGLILACPTTASWSSTDAGVWGQRPAPQCGSAAVKGVRSPDGASWSFDVRGLARTGTLNVVLLAPQDSTATYSVAFQPPAASSVVTQSLAGSPSPSSSRTPEESPHAGRVTPPPVVSPTPTPSTFSSFPTPQPTFADTPTPEDSPDLLAGPLPPSRPGPRGAGWAGLLFAVPTVLLAGAGYGARALMRRRESPKPSEA